MSSFLLSAASDPYLHCEMAGDAAKKAPRIRAGWDDQLSDVGTAVAEACSQ